MSVLDSVISAIRGKRQEQAKTVFGQYAELVESLARDEHVDVDELGIVLDAIDKSDKDLRADVEQKKRRFAAAVRREQLQQAKTAIPKLEAKHEAAKVAYLRAIEKLQPAIDASKAELQEAQLQVGQLLGAENELLSTIMDPQIIAQQADLDARRLEIAGELRKVNDRARDGEQRLQHAQAIINGLESRIEKIKKGEAVDSKNETVRDLQKARNNIQQLRSACNPIFARRDELQAAMRALDGEQRTLTERKLTP